jgi:hypothetical protein
MNDLRERMRGFEEAMRRVIEENNDPTAIYFAKEALKIVERYYERQTLQKDNRRTLRRPKS